MLTDPRSLKPGATNSTTGGTATSAALVVNDGLSSEYISSDGTIRLRISHQYAAGRTGTYPRARRMVRIDKTTNVTDPVTGVVTSQSFGCYIVIDEPVTAANTTGQGLFSDSVIKDQVAALIAELLVTGFQDAILQGQH